MKYRDILGLPKKKAKKKVIPQQPKPSVTKNLKEEFGPLNEWSEKPTGPKRWSKPFDSNMTEFEKEQMNEGPAGEYAKAYTDVKKTYGAFWDSVHEFEYLLKSKGLGRHAKDVNRQYKNTVEKFFKFFHKMMDKLQ